MPTLSGSGLTTEHSTAWASGATPVTADPLYSVGPIPNDIHDIAGGIYTETGCSYYNFETVDGDNFGAVLGAQKGGGWGLFGDDGSYWKYMDIQKTQNAYAIGRQARFEHGETPRPPWEV